MALNKNKYNCDHCQTTAYLDYHPDPHGWLHIRGDFTQHNEATVSDADFCGWECLRKALRDKFLENFPRYDD